jgi:ribonuclease P protein component
VSSPPALPYAAKEKREAKARSAFGRRAQKNYIYFMSATFPKSEKLKSRKTIERLFAEGKSATKFPLKMFYLADPDASGNKAAFAVPKRSFKLAVTRNRIKRQMRESYRLQKGMFDANNSRNFALLFLYIGKEKPKYEELEVSVSKLLPLLIKND